MKHKYYLSEVTYFDTIHYALLIHAETKEVICVWDPVLIWDYEKNEPYFQEWSQGHYFGHDENSMLMAKDYIKTKLLEKTTNVNYELDSIMKDFVTLMEVN